jgi:molybdate transport system ATP-binding protein
VLSVSLVKRLEGFTLDVEWTGSERVVALLGPSGSGKTLTLGCLAGIVRPDGGRIMLDGTLLFDAASAIDVPTRARRLGFVPQGYALFPHLTVAQNIGYGLHGWPRATRAARVTEVLTRLLLADLASRYPRDLSGGQQRVALGRALAPDPAILLLDEPLSALDAPLRRQLRTQLVATLRDWGKTAVLVTHDLAEAYEFAEQIIVYEAGRVLQSAPRHDAVHRPSSGAVARVMGMRNIICGMVARATPERIWLSWRQHVLEAVNPPGAAFLPSPGQPVTFLVRPELVRLIRKDRPSPDPERHKNLLEAEIVDDRDLGTTRVLAARLIQPGPPAQGEADLEIEMSPLVHEMLEVDRHRRWQLSIQPAGIHVLPDAGAGTDGRRVAAAAVGSSPPAAPVSSARAVERRSPRAAALTGAVVGVAGGLLGLGGAEFRLPILVGYFRYGLLRAISLNLAVSLVTVLAAVSSRVALAREIPEASAWPVGVAMMLGGVVGAAIASRWLARVSERRLHAAVRALLLGIGALLIIESATAWESDGLPFDTAARAAVSGAVGVSIGMVSTLLGVAGGELIIPALVLLFAVPIKAAGTLSLLISIPAILVGLARHRARGAFADLSDLRHLIVPMAIGTSVGGIAGGALVAFVPAGAVKLLLGSILIASAVKVFTVNRNV